MKVLTGALLLITLVTAAQGQYLVNTGTPDGTFTENVNNVTGTDPTFVAQKFTLPHLSTVTEIETYGRGQGKVPVQLVNQTGSNVTSANVLTNFILTVPTSNTWVGQAVNLTLSAGDYYLIYSTTNGNYQMDLTGRVTNDIGASLQATNTGANTAFAPASRFQVISNGTTLFAIRITGTTNPITPATLNLANYAGISVSGTVGEIYRIDYATSLAPTNWIALTNFILTSSPTLIFDSTAPIQNNRFYRAVAQ